LSLARSGDDVDAVPVAGVALAADGAKMGADNAFVFAGLSKLLELGLGSVAGASGYDRRENRSLPALWLVALDGALTLAEL